jgi:hypothetical protein
MNDWFEQSNIRSRETGNFEPVFTCTELKMSWQILNAKPEILNKYKIQSTNVQNDEAMAH